MACPDRNFKSSYLTRFSPDFNDRNVIRPRIGHSAIPTALRAFPRDFPAKKPNFSWFMPMHVRRVSWYARVITRYVYYSNCSPGQLSFQMRFFPTPNCTGACNVLTDAFLLSRYVEWTVDAEFSPIEPRRSFSPRKLDVGNARRAGIGAVSLTISYVFIWSSLGCNNGRKVLRFVYVGACKSAGPGRRRGMFYGRF